ncbi:nuclease-like protein [Bacillus oleivorans]|uniref:Nuclease-like protein n=1 Tax=Bacillus oleivorans TaxID=1448271 RepID=A0A285CJU8_9BACI|nr:nuclease-related domain-containing protein [Bacillus oleivorans]SNX67308.1 nuclease-like protein [Bacillus oleivorans]
MNFIYTKFYQNHRKRQDIEKNLMWRKAGFYGEQNLDYHLSHLHDYSLTVFHNLRLPFRGHYFQIDTLILSPFFALILEVKNIAGILRFDPNYDQLIREYSQKMERFPNPLHQASRQKHLLNQWLQKNFNLSIPIEFYIVNTNQATIIEASPESKPIFNKILHLESLTEAIVLIQKKYGRSLITEKQLRSISEKLVKEHTKYFPNLLNIYKIPSSDIIRGVRCTSCLGFSMNRVYGTWLCPKCEAKDKMAHTQAILDSLFLISPTITNKECRDFLKINSPTVVKNLLQSMNLPASGSGKYTVYHRPPLELFLTDRSNF